MSRRLVASAFSMSVRDITLVNTGVLASNLGLRVPVTTTWLRSMVRLIVSVGNAALAVTQANRDAEAKIER